MNEIIVQQNRAFEIEIKIYDNNELYHLQSGETLIFGVKEFSIDDEYIINSEISSNDIMEDEEGYLISVSTSSMNIDVGRYYYDIALKRGEELITIIPCTDFVVQKAIVRSE